MGRGAYNAARHGAKVPRRMVRSPGCPPRGVAIAAIVLALAAGCSRARPPSPAWESIPLGTDAEIEDLLR
ncbi:MAG: hypothetical protein ACRENJ_12635 [Candidatus Eiseniibacteriota bacterium]